MSVTWSGRLLAALSLAAAGLLLLASLQQESPLRPTPLAIRRAPPAPVAHNDMPVAHNDMPVAHKQTHVAHTHTAPNKDNNSIDVIDNEIIKLDVKSVPKVENVPGVVSMPNVKSLPDVPSEVPREPSSVLQADDVTNTTQPRALTKPHTKDKEAGAGAGGGAVLTRDVYVSGHVWRGAGVCRALGRDVRVVVLVTSAPTHRAHRDAARLTWAGDRRRDLALAFFIGLPPANLTAELEKERDLYGDIIMGNFVDSYRNLTLKTISMLEWISIYCPHAHSVLKTDDDMFINIPRLLQFLDARHNATTTIWGRVVRGWMPNRNPRSKYYLPRQQYPDKKFPTFATGPAYALTRDAVRPLLDAALARDARLVTLEDVAVTGLAAKRAHVSLVNAGEFVNKHVRPSACALRGLISLHMVSVDLQLDLWRKLHATHCKG